MEQRINAKGWECPRPIIETKKLLDTMKEGTVITTVDDKLAVKNLVSFAESMGYTVACDEKDDIAEIAITKVWSEFDELAYGAGNLVIQITSDSYGAESEGLGENLMKMFIYTLTESEPKPKTILFINKGAFLTADGSPVLDSLRLLEAGGVEILTCGACINFFSLNDTPQVGGITNMYVMVEKLSNANNTIIV